MPPRDECQTCNRICQLHEDRGKWIEEVAGEAKEAAEMALKTAEQLKTIWKIGGLILTLMVTVGLFLASGIRSDLQDKESAIHKLEVDHATFAATVTDSNKKLDTLLRMASERARLDSGSTW